jgi:hypothetical protein
MRALLCLSLLTACGKHAANEAPAVALDHSAIYPQIMPANDLGSGPVRRPLVDGLVVTLAAQGSNGQAKLLREADLQGMSLDDAYTTAAVNLEAAAKRGEIQIHAEVGKDGHTVDVVWGHDWRAAACLLLPGVRQQAEQTLGGREVFAVIPNRDVLVLFADRAIAAQTLAAEKGAPRPISDRVLRAAPGALAWAP